MLAVSRHLSAHSSINSCIWNKKDNSYETEIDLFNWINNQQTLDDNHKGNFRHGGFFYVIMNGTIAGSNCHK